MWKLSGMIVNDWIRNQLNASHNLNKPEMSWEMTLKDVYSINKYFQSRTKHLKEGLFYIRIYLTLNLI